MDAIVADMDAYAHALTAQIALSDRHHVRRMWW